jgi:hypothetical protein
VANVPASNRYLDLEIGDPLYGNYCTTSCEYGVPLACDWEPECNNSNIDSIQV